MFAECSKGFTSVNNKEWLCRTCHFAIKQGRVSILFGEKWYGFSRTTTRVTTIPNGRTSNITYTYIFPNEV